MERRFAADRAKQSRSLLGVLGIALGMHDAFHGLSRNISWSFLSLVVASRESPVADTLLVPLAFQLIRESPRICIIATINARWCANEEMAAAYF